MLRRILFRQWIFCIRYSCLVLPPDVRKKAHQQEAIEQRNPIHDEKRQKNSLNTKHGHGKAEKIDRTDIVTEGKQTLCLPLGEFSGAVKLTGDARTHWKTA